MKINQIVHLSEGVAESTGDKPFDQMMTTIKQGTNKQKTADRKEQQKQTQQQARNAFGNMFGGGNPADKLKIREQGVAEGYSNTTFNVDRRKLNVPDLIKAGAILVTQPHSEQGWETDNKEDWAFSLLSLYNVLQGGWPSEAKKYLKPESYKQAEQQINSSAPNLGSDKLVYDGKYNQILWSIKKLGIPDNVAFLDKGQQGVAEGSLNELSSDLLKRSAQAATDKRNQAMDPELHNALGGGYMNPLATHYDNVSQKMDNRAAQVRKKETIQKIASKIASPAVMRKIGMAEQGVAEGSLGTALPWPNVVNKVSGAMKAMGWKGTRKADGTFMFSTRGQETDDQYYIVIIDNAGEGFFTYALGTIEEGDPRIGEQESLPNTEASVSELMNAIRDGFGLSEQGLSEVSNNTLKSYQQKVSSDSMKHKADPTKRSPEKANRSVAGFAKAQNRSEQGVAEAEKKGLYYYVNKRKKAGTSRDADSPKAPTAQAWKDAAKTAKTEGVAENKLPKPYKKWAS